MKENPPCDKAIPGPGTYTVTPKIGNEAKKYSIYGRTQNHCNIQYPIFIHLVNLTTQRNNPGPGAYEPKIGISSNGVYLVSGYKNSRAPNFSLPTLSRFAYGKNENVPGPGTYGLKTGISDANSNFLSTFRSPKTRTFYHSDRKTIDIPSYSKSNDLPPDNPHVD